MKVKNQCLTKFLIGTGCAHSQGLERCSLPEHERPNAGHGGTLVERMGSVTDVVLTWQAGQHRDQELQHFGLGAMRVATMPHTFHTFSAYALHI